LAFSFSFSFPLFPRHAEKESSFVGSSASLHGRDEFAGFGVAIVTYFLAGTMNATGRWISMATTWILDELGQWAGGQR
jgi:hypothetical protein